MQINDAPRSIVNSQIIKGVKEMKNIKPILFSSLIVGVLSVAQTDAFARGEVHGHGADAAPAEGVNKQGNVNSHGVEGAAPAKGINKQSDALGAEGLDPKGLNKGPEEIKVD